MRNVLKFFIVIYAVACLSPAFANLLPEGGAMPEISLSVPQLPEHRTYLGLPEQGMFSLPQIKAEVLIIEIFSMYCPHCQREAPSVNSLHQKIENDKVLKSKVKMIGIGVGNSDFEVNFFRKTYHVLFPLFSDADFSIHKKIGEVRTPYFICIKINKDQTHSIFYSKLGPIQNADDFLNLISQQLQLK